MGGSTHVLGRHPPGMVLTAVTVASTPVRTAPVASVAAAVATGGVARKPAGAHGQPRLLVGGEGAQELRGSMGGIGGLGVKTLWLAVLTEASSHTQPYQLLSLGIKGGGGCGCAGGEASGGGWGGGVAAARGGPRRRRRDRISTQRDSESCGAGRAAATETAWAVHKHLLPPAALGARHGPPAAHQLRLEPPGSSAPPTARRGDSFAGAGAAVRTGRWSDARGQQMEQKKWGENEGGGGHK